MPETIVLDKPEQIAAWYLLSLRSRLYMQTRGLRTPGIVALCNERGYSNKKTAKGCLADVERILDEAGIAYTKR